MKSNLLQYSAALALLACVACPLEAAEIPSDALAKTVLDKAGIRVGVCEIPRVGDGALAASLAKAGVPVVHALATDTKLADVARQPAASAGLLGSQVIIETGKPESLPLGDWVADLYLVADATDADLKTLSAAEAGRVLSPYRGVALVGNPAGAKGGLSKAALAEWAKGAGGTATITDDASGLWAVVKMPPLKGGDDWSHFYHAPDGNPVSKDTAFRGSNYQIQWRDFPLRNGARSFTTLVAGGRLFIANCSLFQGSFAMSTQTPLEIDARSLYNGKLLWRRPIALSFGDMGSVMVATPDRLFVKDGASVLVLNPETGVEMNRIAATKAPLHVRWLALSDGVLLTLAGPRPFISEDDFKALLQPPNLTPEQLRQWKWAQVNESLNGQGLVAWDAQTGKELWRSAETRILIRKMSVSQGRVFLDADDRNALALDLHTGRQLWKTATPPLPPKKFQTDDHIGMDFRGEPAAMSTAKAYVIADEMFIGSTGNNYQYQAFDAENGKLLWTSDPKVIHGQFPMIMNDKILQNAQYYLDLFTGKDIAITGGDYCPRGSDSCGHASAVESGLWIGKGVWDMKSGTQIIPYWRRTACAVGYFVADGVQVMWPNTCTCSYIKGTFVVRPAAPAQAPATSRLEKGDAPIPATTKVDASDWTTYRSDETRKGSSPAIIPAQSGVRWTYTPSRPAPGGGMERLPNHLERDRFATQSVSVGDRLWFGTAEGSLVCLDQKTGTRQWEYWTAGQILSTPAWLEGRIYAGSADGWLYCLDAATGKLAWRFRVSPQAGRRIAYMGGLASAWPVQAILAHEGVVYATAGLLGFMDGSVMCAVDAKTGAERWTKVYRDTEFTPDNKRPAGATSENQSPSAGGGQMAWYGGKIWWLAGSRGPTIVDPATGALHQAVDESGMALSDPRIYGMWRGYLNEDIGILPGGWVTMGNDPYTREGKTLMLQSGPNGIPAGGAQPPQFLVLEPNRQAMSRELPVWDQNELLFWVKSGGPTVLRNYAEALNQELAAHPVSTDGKKKFVFNGPNGLVRNVTLNQPADKQHPLMPEATWKLFQKRSPGGAMLLAGNAVVLTARGTDYFPGFYGRFINYGSWRVFVINRADGSILFETPLPDAPARSGMSLTRAGDVLVPLQDGRVVCIGGGAAPQPVPSAEVAGAKPGLRMDSYVTDIPRKFYHSWSDEDLRIMTPVKTAVANEAKVKDNTDAAQSVIWLHGFVEVPETGAYRFAVKNDKGVACLFHLLDRSGYYTEGAFLDQGSTTEAMLLAKGKHPISLIIMRDQGGIGTELLWEGPGFKLGDIPATALSHLPPTEPVAANK